MLPLSLFQSQGSGGQVADFGRSEVLDGTGVGVAGFHSPLSAIFCEELEGCAVQFNQSLADNGLVSTMAALDVHHLGDGHTACDPLFSGSLQVGDLGQVTGVAVLDQHGCVVTQGVAVVSIEVGGESAAAFVTQEVMQGGELTLVGAGSLAGSQVILNQSGEQLLGLNQGDLNVTVRIALQEQLLLNVLG